MIDRKVLEAETAFLLLIARRVLNFQRKAEEQGEEYHDLQPFSDLQCGFAAKMRFIKGAAGQYQPELYLGPASVHPIVDASLPAALVVASEILGGPAFFRGDTDTGHRRFSLEKDK